MLIKRTPLYSKLGRANVLKNIYKAYFFERKLKKIRLFSLSLRLEMTISKAKIKFIRQLEHKKQRREEGLFVAEGPKVVGDLLDVMKPKMVVATHQWLQQESNRPCLAQCEVIEVTDEELARCSLLRAPQQVLALFPIMQNDIKSPSALALALDGVQDPGNLGTIIRIADWFGIEQIFCSMETADMYNPKVVQATMGSLARVKVTYCDLVTMVKSLPDDYPVYGTLLDGKDIYASELSDKGLIVMGNEGNGISEALRQHINRRLLIPSFPPERPTAESLNVAIATAICVAEFRRRS